MRIIPLGNASALGKSADGWTSNLLDRKLLLDAAPQAGLALRALGVAADDLEAVAITHTHGDHTFGFPFILAERSPDNEPLAVIGPQGTREKLERLCALAFSVADPKKMRVQEIPIDRQSEVKIGPYDLLAVPMVHSQDSLGFRITGPDGTTLGLSGDSGWCDGLQTILRGVDAALVEMTFIEETREDHLTLREHLPRILELLPAPAPVYLTHLGFPRIDYLNAMQKMAGTLPPAAARELFRALPVEPLKEYNF